MQNAAPVQLRQFRDLGQIISTTFQFLRIHWKPLFRAIGIICIPLGLIAGFLIGRSLGDLQRMSMMNDIGSNANAFDGAMSNFLPMAAGYLLMLLVMVMLFAIVYEYLRAYHLGENHGITTADLWKRSMEQFWNYLGISILVMILVVIGSVLCIIPGIFAFVAFSLTYMVHAIERNGVTASMKRSHLLIKDRWWETFGLIIIVGLVQGVIAYALMIPTMIISVIIGINTTMEGVRAGGEPDMGWYPLFMAIMMTINLLVTLLTYPIMAVALGLKYFSIVEEKEGLGIRQKIQGFEQA
ncbi:MAG: hypothetical protein M3R08_03270 [Bacteroidota bacterium]|nr:hypothetical protein [Bacteroidota bacterium]